MLSAREGLHEQATYKVKGTDSESTCWKPQRGLREGCATSPVSFNIYHFTVMREAKARRSREASTHGLEVDIRWQYIPGSSLPPKDLSKARKSTAKKTVVVTESLFADDTTLVGTRKEMAPGKEVVNATMGTFEERCHPDKEEHLELGRPDGDEIRMLGSYMGRSFDVKKRIQRMGKASATIEKRLKGSSLSKKTQAKIVDVCVESTGLFDAQTRPWFIGEIRRMQSMVDKIYRYIWSGKTKPPLIEMQEVGYNMFQVRQELGINTVETKITKRTLERIDHVRRMKPDSLTKKVTLGWPERPKHPLFTTRTQTTLDYWRRCLKKAGIDIDTAEQFGKKRHLWKKVVQERVAHLRNWETAKAERTQVDKDRAEEPGKVCHFCDRTLKNQLGLKVHMRGIHREGRDDQKQCSRYGTWVAEQAILTNHTKVCEGAPPGSCPYCRKKISKSNMARHKRMCTQERLTTKDSTDQRPSPGSQEEGPRRKGPRYPCKVCEKNVVRDAIWCVDCQRWFHRRCLKMSPKELRILAKYKWQSGCTPPPTSDAPRTIQCRPRECKVPLGPEWHNKNKSKIASFIVSYRV